MPALEDIIAMLADAPRVLEFTPSNEAKARAWELLAHEKAGLLNEYARRELDHYAQLEHIMRLAKAKARQKQATLE